MNVVAYSESDYEWRHWTNPLQFIYKEAEGEIRTNDFGVTSLLVRLWYSSAYSWGLLSGGYERSGLILPCYAPNVFDMHCLLML